MTSAWAYCSSRIFTVSVALFVQRAPQSATLTACQESGATVFSMCTRMASKMAQHRACSGTLIASSLSVTAGYFALGILLRSVQGRALFEPPPLAGNSSSASNMKAFHCAHHVGMSGSGREQLLITVGRQALSPLARSMVFVKRSGIDASRFAPICLSFRKVLMMRLLEKSERHSSRVSSTPDHPSAAMAVASSSNRASGKTEETSTSWSPVGLSMKACTSSISRR
mmetsp:Transcript_63197/g.199646  ORF Transcript_63197/g.199646 Transcript_63197/m.199646 type:complete len:226 (-) Transcript_63197:171-848(-)